MRWAKLLVCGGRDFEDRTRLYARLDKFHSERGVALLIEGGQRGADTLAGDWARERSVPLRVVPAEWKRYGILAGIIRNRKMLAMLGASDVVLAFPGGKGTASMVGIALQAGREVLRG